MIIIDFSSNQTYCFGAQKKRLRETFLLHTKNICFIDSYLDSSLICQLSAFIVSKIYYELGSISDNRSYEFSRFTCMQLIFGCIGQVIKCFFDRKDL